MSVISVLTRFQLDSKREARSVFPLSRDDKQLLHLTEIDAATALGSHTELSMLEDIIQCGIRNFGNTCYAKSHFVHSGTSSACPTMASKPRKTRHNH